MIIDKNNIKIILIILVIGLGIGYAYINSDLNINGTAQVRSANWDVHWANVAVTTGSVSASSPTISNQTTVNYSVVLNNPGDYYEFTVDAVNGGTIDAMIDTIDSKLNGSTITTLPDYLNYSVTYSDGKPLEPNHLLKANFTEKYKVRIEYNEDIELNQIPASNQTLSLQFTVTYRQATEDGVGHITTKYSSTVLQYGGGGTIDDYYVVVGQPISNNITQYDTAKEALEAYWPVNNAYPNHFFLRHTVQGGIVTENYVGFEITPGMVEVNSDLTAGTYYLRGGGASYNLATNSYNSDSIHYESNKATLLAAYGSANCSESVTSFSCSNNRGYYHIKVRATATTQGFTVASNQNWNCQVFDDSRATCENIE